MFQDKTSLIYCNNIAGLIKSMGLEYDATKWRLLLIPPAEVFNIMGIVFHLSLLGIQHPPVEPNKILLPPIDIKLGVMKKFVKAMAKGSSRFTFLMKFPRISMEKLEVGIFDGPQIRELMEGPMFDEALGEAELSVRQSLKQYLQTSW